jgi:hypothetical protein
VVAALHPVADIVTGADPFGGVAVDGRVEVAEVDGPVVAVVGLVVLAAEVLEGVGLVEAGSSIR